MDTKQKSAESLIEINRKKNKQESTKTQHEKNFILTPKQHNKHNNTKTPSIGPTKMLFKGQKSTKTQHQNTIKFRPQKCS